MSLLLCFDALSLADWLFHYISMWFCVVTSNTWANTHTSPASRNSNMKNTWENLSYCCSHRNAHTHTLRRRRWFCIFPYFIWDFFWYFSFSYLFRLSSLIHSFARSFCLHFSCRFSFSFHYGLSSFDMPRKHRTIPSFWWPMCHKHTHARSTEHWF